MCRVNDVVPVVDGWIRASSCEITAPAALFGLCAKHSSRTGHDSRLFAPSPSAAVAAAATMKKRGGGKKGERNMRMWWNLLALLYSNFK